MLDKQNMRLLLVSNGVEVTAEVGGRGETVRVCTHRIDEIESVRVASDGNPMATVVKQSAENGGQEGGCTHINKKADQIGLLQERFQVMFRREPSGVQPAAVQGDLENVEVVVSQTEEAPVRVPEARYGRVLGVAEIVGDGVQRLRRVLGALEQGVDGV